MRTDAAHGSGSRLVLLTFAEELARLEPEWTALLKDSRADTLFLAWVWMWRWWQVYGRTDGLRVFAVRDRDDRLSALAPLHIRPLAARGIPWGRELAFLGSGEVKSDYLDLIVRGTDEGDGSASLIEAVLASPGWDVLRLEGIPEASPTLPRLAQALRASRLPFRIELEDVCPYLPLAGNGAPAREPIGPGLRADIRRKRRALERAGSLEFRMVTDRPESGAAIDAVAALNAKRLATKGIRGGFRSPAFAAFQRAVAADLSLTDQLRLCLVTLNSAPIAGLWLFAYGGKYLYYQSGLDPAWARFSPGTLAFGFAVERAVLEGMREFDFLRGQEAYKARWTRQVRRLVRVTAYRRTAEALVARAWDAGRAAVRQMRGRAGRRLKRAGGPGVTVAAPAAGSP